MNKVYMIVEDIDLGYHVKRVFFDQNRANTVCAEMNQNWRDQKIKDLMSSCGYTLKRATDYCKVDLYDVEEHEVEQ